MPIRKGRVSRRKRFSRPKIRSAKPISLSEDPLEELVVKDSRDQRVEDVNCDDVTSLSPVMSDSVHLANCTVNDGSADTCDVPVCSIRFSPGINSELGDQPRAGASTPLDQGDLALIYDDTGESCSPITTQYLASEGSFEAPSHEELNKSSNVQETSVKESTTADVMFKVAEMEVVSGLLPLQSNSVTDSFENSNTSLELLSIPETRPESEPLLIATSPPDESSLKTVEIQIRGLLPLYWECRLRETGISLERLSPNTGNCTVVQRNIFISRNGTAELFVHGKPLRLDHEIWGLVPCSVSLDTHPVHDFIEFASALVKLIQRYEICPGCPQSQDHAIARKMESAKFDCNSFGESKYSTTYRSVDCGMLVTLCTQTSACKPCKALQNNIRRRLVRQPTDGSPHPCTNNKFLNTPQARKKLERERRNKRNGKRREAYFSAKFKAIISKEGNNIEEGLNEDFANILQGYLNTNLEQSENDEDLPQFLDSLDSSETQKELQNSGSQKSSPKHPRLSHLQRIFIEEQIKASSVKKACGVRWHPLMIRLALRIHMTSPSAYRDLASSGIIKLPSERLLYDYSHHELEKEGISRPAVREIYNSMKKEGYAEDSHQRYHVLLMDEMTISKNLVYSRATGELTGFVRLSELEQETENLELALRIGEEKADRGRQSKDRLLVEEEANLIRQKSAELNDFGNVVPDICDKVLSFMVVGITNSVRTVVASYGVKNTSMESLTMKVWEVIGKLERADIHVLALVCDGHPINRAFIKSHIASHEPLPSGTVFSTVNRVARSRDIFFFSDVPHLLKTIRNCFHNSESGKRTRCLRKNGQSITWRTIVKLYEDEKHNVVKMAYKLNAQVVYLNSYSGMKVSYAARVFSATVANAIEAMKYPDTEETVIFIRKVNEFFDCLNGCSSAEAVHKRNPNLAPYRSINDNRFKILRDFLHYLQSWSSEVTDPKFCISHETLTGIEMSINSFEKCVQFMLGKGASFIMARVFCQDPLEQFFGKQRASCGGSTNPNMARFLGNQNKIRLLKTIRFQTAKGNTEDITDESQVSELSTPLLKRKNGTGVDSRIKLVKRSIADDREFASDQENLAVP